jgi:hypothetical protein
MGFKMKNEEKEACKFMHACVLCISHAWGEVGRWPCLPIMFVRFLQSSAGEIPHRQTANVTAFFLVVIN